MMRALAMMCAMTMAYSVEEVVIIVKRSSTSEPVSHSVQPERRRGDYIRAIWEDPDQTFIDTDIGPMPLYTDVVYDANGVPRVRYPDPLTKVLMDNPTPATALFRLEGEKNRFRRYKQAQAISTATAIEAKYFGPDDFAPPPGKMPQDSAFTPPYDRDRSEWGVPVMNPQQARLAGVKPEEVPETPGRVTTRYVEIVYIWDRRCPYSMQGIRDFANFGEELFNRKLGPRALTVSLDNDKDQLDGTKKYLEYLGIPMSRVDNFTDITDLRTRLKITRTPTYIFLDRRTGKILRLEGLQSGDAIRVKLLELVGHQSGSWNDADPAWFRPTQPAADGGGAPGGVAAGDKSAIDPALLETSSPVLPASNPIRSWNPAGQSD